jgi:hypothetical protein
MCTNNNGSAADAFLEKDLRVIEDFMRVNL